VDKARYFAAIERVRGKFATLINADADEIAFTKNASDGINMIASAIDWNAGDNIILCTELEHPNNVYPWLNVRDRHGVTIRTVPQNAGEIDVARMADTIDDRTRLVTASTVTFSPGLRTSIETLGTVCHAYRCMHNERRWISGGDAKSSTRSIWHGIPLLPA
jgi:selenocysteine lyase/cysteine desulfurase